MLVVYYLSSFFTLLNPCFVLGQTNDTTNDTIKDNNETLTVTQKKYNESKFDELIGLSPDIFCKFQPNVYKCGNKHTSYKYYYDVEKNACLRHVYGNCKAYNMFTTSKNCKRQCRDKSLYPTSSKVSPVIFCRFQPEFGTCNSYFPKWYFDINEMTCRGFSYSGCGGNINRFDHPEVCFGVCRVSVEHRNTTYKYR